MKDFTSDKNVDKRQSVGSLLKQAMAEANISTNALAERIGKSRQTISAITNDHSGITKDVSRALGEVFGQDEDHWYQLSRSSELQSTTALGILPGHVLVDHQIRLAVHAGEIEIDPFDQSQLRQASYDLTLGDLVIDLDTNEAVDWDGHRLHLDSRQVVNVETREHLHLKNAFVGRVGAPTSLSRLGIHVTHGFQIDPDYAGRLQFSIFNPTSRLVSVDARQAVLSIEFTALSERPERRFDQSMPSQEAMLVKQRDALLASRLEPLVCHLVNTTANGAACDVCIDGTERFDIFGSPSVEEATRAVLADFVEIVRRAFDIGSASEEERDRAKDVLSAVKLDETAIEVLLESLEAEPGEVDGYIQLPWHETPMRVPAAGKGARRAYVVFDDLDLLGMIRDQDM